MNRSCQPAECRCHDPAVFGHTDKNCRQALHLGNDVEWRKVRLLRFSFTRPDPDGMTWTGNTWVRTAELEQVRR